MTKYATILKILEKNPNLYTENNHYLVNPGEKNKLFQDIQNDYFAED